MKKSAKTKTAQALPTETRGKTSVLWEHAIERFFNFAGESFFIVDGNGNFVEANDAYCDLVGYFREDLLSMSLADIDTLDPAKYREKTLATGKAQFLTSYRRGDGRLLDVEVRAAQFTVEGLDYHFIFVHDIGDREEKVWSELTKNSLLELYSKNASRKEYLDAVSGLLKSWSGCRYVGIRLVNESGNMPYEAHAGFSDEFIETESWIPAASNECCCSRVITGNPASQERPYMTPEGSFFCNNFTEMEESLPPDGTGPHRGVCFREGFRSLAVIPFSHNSETLGAIQLADEREGMVPHRVINFIQSISPLVGEAVYRFNMEDEIRDNYTTQIVVNSILHLSLGDFTLGEILEKSLEFISTIPWLAGNSGSAILLAGAEPGTFTPGASRGIAGDLERLCASHSARECPCTTALEEKKIQLVSGAGKGGRSNYCVPIISGGVVLGLLILWFDGVYRQRDKETLYLAAVSTALAGIIIHKRDEKDLELERLKLRSILGAMNDGVVIVGSGGDIEFVNPVMEREFGAPGGVKCHEYLGCVREKCVWCAGDLAATEAGRREWNDPGRGMWYDVYSTVLRNADGSASLIEFFHDITALRRSEARIAHQANILDKVNDAIMEYGEDDIITYWNSAAETIYGWTAAEAVGRSRVEILGTDTGEWPGTGPAPGDKDNFRGEVVHRRKDGTPVDIEATGIRLRGPGGDGSTVVTVNRDITGRKAIEREMGKLSMAVEQASDWVIITDRGGTIEYSNRIVKQITGYSKEEIVGSNPRIMKSGKHDAAFYRNLWDTILGGDTFRAIFTNRKKDGELCYIDMAITPLKDGRGDITHFIASGKDITQQKHMEDRLISLVHFDALTGLPNRTLFMDRLGQVLLRGEYTKRLITGCVIVAAVILDQYRHRSRRPSQRI